MTPRDLAGFVRRWRGELTREMFVPMDAGDLDALLHRLAGILHTGDPAVCAAVGSALVEAHLTEPAVLAATVTVIGNHLPGPRQVEIQAAVAAGYAQAIRSVTMAEQELLNSSVLDAHAAAERALRASEAQLRAVVDSAAVGIGVSTMDGRIVRVNQAFADLLGCTTERLCELEVPQLTHPSDPPDMWRYYAELVSGERDHVRLEKAYYRADGGEVWTDMTSSLIRDENGEPQFTVAMVQDISDRRRLQDRLEHQATHDPLTGLPNRAMIGAHLDRILGADDPDARVGVCYLDLDGFKRVNDTLGHQVGDELLVAVAGRLTECARDAGGIAGRMSGDEFVVLSEDPADLTGLAAVILTSLSHPFDLGRHRTRISASIGVVDSDVRSTTPADLLKAADLALYVAKSEGRGRFVTYDADRDARQAARYALAAAMPDALDRDEFTVVYQPLVSLADQRVLGVEALVRWQHPVLGELSPDSFIPLAEETGVILRLGHWVLEQACAQAASWAREFPDPQIFVSVNMTVSQAHEPGMAAEVDAVLARTGLAPGLLVLELTESAVMDTDGAPLRPLAERGIRIAIDDFGTGYSNLAYLRRLPVHILKLAGPFVDGLRTSSRVDEQIVETVVRLAHAIGLTVTAEAVETRPQADRLRDLGCDTGQGWLFARPLPPDGVTEMLRRTSDGRTPGAAISVNA